MNRKEFIENFDYTIFVDYLKSIIMIPAHITHTQANQLLDAIFEKYPELDKNKEFTTYETQTLGHCYVDELDTYQYYKDITCLDFQPFYPYIYYKNFIDDTIDYNENMFLLYSLLYTFRLYCKKHYPELYSTFRILFHSFFVYIASRKYIKEHYPYNYFLNICSFLKPYLLYADTDVIYLRNINRVELQNLLEKNHITAPHTIIPIKYFYIERKKRYSSYYKNNDEYKFVTKGFLKKEDDEINKIKRNFLSDFRIEKIKNLLNDNAS